VIFLGSCQDALCYEVKVFCFLTYINFRILSLSIENLQQSFETDFPHNCNEEANTYARDLLEYCCHKALHEVTTRPDYLADKNLRRLMFDMMLAWETPGAQDASVENVRNFQGCILCILFVGTLFIIWISLKGKRS
jgi:hypothetical protein